jgi:hypothetical protein
LGSTKPIPEANYYRKDFFVRRGVGTIIALTQEQVLNAGEFPRRAARLHCRDEDRSKRVFEFRFE